jgi:hypothetical protein
MLTDPSRDIGTVDSQSPANFAVAVSLFKHQFDGVVFKFFGKYPSFHIFVHKHLFCAMAVKTSARLRGGSPICAGNPRERLFAPTYYKRSILANNLSR